MTRVFTVIMVNKQINIQIIAMATLSVVANLGFSKMCNAYVGTSRGCTRRTSTCNEIILEAQVRENGERLEKKAKLSC